MKAQTNLMKRHTLFLSFFIFSSYFTIQAQSLQESLLGKWKLTKDEGFEFFITSPTAQNRPDDEMEKFYDLMERFHDQTYKNFYSKDSMTSTIIDQTEIVQERSVWNVREADSVITWASKFAPKVLQAKVLKITDQELILIYLTRDQTPGQFKTIYKKVESY